MQKVKAKKYLGQHFLNDETIAQRIADSLTLHDGYKKVLEIGPGMGVLTQFLLQRKEFETHVVEVDKESVVFLKKKYERLKNRITEYDFLKLDLNTFSEVPFAIIGNFPYNISTQILFRVYDNRNKIPEVVGMFQKEVAERIASKPGNKSYGIMSVLLQAYYDIEYLFTVEPTVFTPKPRVKSGVIRLRRNKTEKLNCDEKFFKLVVKTAFNQRRKILSNALKPLMKSTASENLPYMACRAEELEFEKFVELTNLLVNQNK
ncbi:MAG: 16S rRNA (adenine(1518)-N(6)/adenine(1519)-N(6))-dimethyltransferase RsmA [Bacteroidia bacterium]